MAVTAGRSLDNRGVSLMRYDKMKHFIEERDDLGAAGARRAVMSQFRRENESKWSRRFYCEEREFVMALRGDCMDL